MSENQKMFTAEELEVLAQSVFSNSINIIRHAYVDICGDLVAGALLGQILYWFEPDKNGKSKVRIVKDGHYWLAKYRDDWYEEIRISPKQYDRAVKILEEKEFIVKQNYMFNGLKTPHLRPNYEAINQAIHSWMDNIKVLIVEGGKPVLPKGKNLEESTVSASGDSKEEAKSLKSSRFYPKVKTGFDEKVKPELPKGENRSLPKGETITESTSESFVVVVKELIDSFAYNFEGYELKESTAKTILKKAMEAGKDISDCIENTLLYHALKNEEIENPVGAVMHEIETGWDISALSAKKKKELPRRKVELTRYDWVNKNKNKKN